MSVNLYVLHGFLGLPSDFSLLKLPPNWEMKAIDYLHVRELSPENSLRDWGSNFCKFVLNKEKSVNSSGSEFTKPSSSTTLSEKNDQSIATQPKRWLLGYSQGGRLALHAFFENLYMWEGLILLSAHPGIRAEDKLTEDTERLHRKQFHEQWVRRFEKQDFNKTVEQWNALPVFAGSKHEPVRLEENYNRHQLTKCLSHWSLSLQKDFHPEIKVCQKKIFYVAGQFDEKYKQIAHQLENLNPNVVAMTAPNSGHRVLFDNPDFISELLKTL